MTANVKGVILGPGYLGRVARPFSLRKAAGEENEASGQGVAGGTDTQSDRSSKVTKLQYDEKEANP